MRFPVLVILAALAWSPLIGPTAAQAAYATAAYTPFDLAEEAIPLGGTDVPELDAVIVQVLPDAGLPISLDGCALSVAGDRLTGACPALWQRPTIEPLRLYLHDDEGASLEILLSPGHAPGQRLEVRADDGDVGIPGAPWRVAFWDDEAGGWSIDDRVEGETYRLAEPLFTAVRAGRLVPIFAQQADDRVVRHQLELGAAPPPGPTPRPATIRPAPMNASQANAVPVMVREGADPQSRGSWVVTVPEELDCPPRKLPYEDMIVVCVDATQDILTYRLVPEGTRLTKPNRYFYIHVVHFVDRKVDINLGGQIGTWVPGSRGDLRFRSDGGRGAGIAGMQGVDAPDLTISTQTLAPRQPGYAPLTIRLRDLQNQEIGSPMQVEFWIEETYSGAFRLGVAGIFLGGVDQSYSRVQRPGAQQAEITATAPNPIDVDLIIGYAPYLDRGGRAASGCQNAPFCFSPFFGIGLLSPSSVGGLDFMKSVHLGVEWELTSTFSIGLTANLRRVSRLGGGLRVGAAIDGEVVTEDRFILGAGVIINLSPAFFKVGASGAAALLQ